jgi:hypothetical protein
VNYSTVKQRLAEAVAAAGIPKLDAYAYMPTSPHLPCFVAGEVSIEVNQTFRGCDLAYVTCSIFVSAADDLDGQQMLDKLISRSGLYSVRAALMEARGASGESALGGACDDFSIDRIDGYGLIQVGDNQTFYGANMTVRLIGSGDD